MIVGESHRKKERFAIVDHMFYYFIKTPQTSIETSKNATLTKAFAPIHKKRDSFKILLVIERKRKFRSLDNRKEK